MLRLYFIPRKMSSSNNFYKRLEGIGPKEYNVISSKLIKENKMRKGILVASAILSVIIIAGCTSGSHLTLGPGHAESSVSAHEWRDAAFVSGEQEGKGSCVGSTFGFLSSELCGEWRECNEASIGLYSNWDQDQNTNGTVDQNTSGVEVIAQ